MLEAANPDWRLRIVGPDELGYARELVALAAELKVRRVSVAKTVAGDAKIAAYQQAVLFVLPTLNENFAISVAETLAAGTPVIATKGAPWRALPSEGCGCGAWMARDFSWDRRRP
jgi:glycosyltransferase involved in cell wall biosynthesis